jgi:trans-feruloyl-CoA hydratase/vanillin synthase
MHYVKPTIAMVNGWCFGGGITPLVACDLAIAADEAVLGISEINWGIIPAGNVTRALAEKLPHADALYYIMTGETFDGRKAAEMKLVNLSVPRAELRERTRKLARTLLEKNPVVLRTAKNAFKRVGDLPWDTAADYLGAKAFQASATDPTKGRDKAMKQFLDDKSFRPGLGNYDRDA